MYIDPPSDLKRWLKLGPEDVLRLRKAVLRPHQRTSSMASKAQPSPPTSWLFLLASSRVKHVSLVDVPIKLKAAVADSSMSLVPETHMDRWKRQGNVQGVFGRPC